MFILSFFFIFPSFSVCGWLCFVIGWLDVSSHIFWLKGFYVCIRFSPAYLEDKLVKHADISDAAVIGIPAGASGELPKAFVVLRQGSNITKEDIILFIQGKQ